MYRNGNITVTFSCYKLSGVQGESARMKNGIE